MYDSVRRLWHHMAAASAVMCNYLSLSLFCLMAALLRCLAISRTWAASCGRTYKAVPVVSSTSGKHAVDGEERHYRLTDEACRQWGLWRGHPVSDEERYDIYAYILERAALWAEALVAANEAEAAYAESPRERRADAAAQVRRLRKIALAFTDMFVAPPLEVLWQGLWRRVRRGSHSADLSACCLAAHLAAEIIAGGGNSVWAVYTQTIQDLRGQLRAGEIDHATYRGEWWLLMSVLPGVAVRALLLGPIPQSVQAAYSRLADEWPDLADVPPSPGAWTRRA